MRAIDAIYRAAGLKPRGCLPDGLIRECRARIYQQVHPRARRRHHQLARDPVRRRRPGVALAQREFTQHFPQPGWVEHDPIEIWETQRATRRGAARGAGLDARDIAAIGITNQRETTVVWDARPANPLHHAIVWQDRRTAGACERLRAAGHEAEIAARTGLLLDPYFSGTKLAWLLDHVPGARGARGARRARVRDHGHLAAVKLTGGRRHVTDVDERLPHAALDMRTGDWDDELLELFGMPRACLPRGRRLLPGPSADASKSSSAASIPSPASPATSRPRCSARPASLPAWPRTPTAPAASCS